ncbi:polysaccharide deacetylase family protein [Bdellovibrio sp. HCB337]|uniref:polysaccharide deacetylase family protein n=1 Tax=Bdellovibrio sp. HCB337 TaxID=3394358 RepID=UPI0039A66E48
MKFLLVLFLFATTVQAKKLALSFDDAPGDDALHFTSKARTTELLKKLKSLNSPPVLIFANPCNGSSPESNYAQLKQFKDAGHIIGNHTCTHPRFDEAGVEKVIEDTQKSETLMNGLMTGSKYFRFPFFNEGKDREARDLFRSWLETNKYQNVSASLENEDPVFSKRLNDAKKLSKKINYEKVKALFIKHIIEGAEFYDKVAVDVLGRSPKHIILLHQKDATVLFIDDLVRELRSRGWTIISAEDAVKDPLYSMKPKNTLSTYGIIGQLAYEKQGSFKPYYDFSKLKQELDSALDLSSKK